MIQVGLRPHNHRKVVSVNFPMPLPNTDSELTATLSSLLPGLATRPNKCHPWDYSKPWSRCAAQSCLNGFLGNARKRVSSTGTPTQLLIDAGISGSQAQQRLEAHGVDINSVDAVLISHDHIDHTRCMGIFHRKFGLPVYSTEATLAEVRAYRDMGRMDDVRHFESGTSFRIGRLTIETIPRPQATGSWTATIR